MLSLLLRAKIPHTHIFINIKFSFFYYERLCNIYVINFLLFSEFKLTFVVFFYIHINIKIFQIIRVFI